MRTARLWRPLLGTILVLGAARNALAQEREPAVHVVQNGDTCVGISTRYYGDAKGVDLIHDANEWMGPPPHYLHEGQRLVIPPKPAAGAGRPDAKLTRVRNQVEVTTSEVKPGKPNDPLFRGNRVGTKANSAADVTFRDETQVKLGESSLVVILGDSNGRAARVNATDVTLVTGSVRAHLAALAGKRPAPPTVTTEGAVVALKSGEAQVSRDQASTTRLAVYRGGSTLSAQQKTVEVIDGFGSKVEKGHVPTPPAPLPPAPEWSSSPPEIVLARERVDLAFAFAPSHAAGPPAAEWHVQLARDAAFDDVVVDTRVPLAIERIEAKNLGPDTYYARVSAIDADHFEGKWSPAARTIVGRVVVEELRGRRARVDVDVPAEVRCAIEGASGGLPLEVGRDLAHSITCGLPDTQAHGALTIPALAIGHAKLSAAPLEMHGRSGTVRLAVLDERGDPVDGLHPVAEPPPDLRIGELRPAAAAGVYVAPFAWSAPPRAIRLRVRLLASTVGETNVVAFDKEPRSGGAGAPIELAAAGVGMWRSFEAVGVGFDVEGRAAIPMRSGALLVGASSGLVTLLPTRQSVSAPAGADAGGEARVTGSVVQTRLLAGYRFGHARTAPYVTLGPELLRQRVAADFASGRREGREWLVGGAASAGVDLDVGVGTLFGEARASVATAVSPDPPALPASGVLLLLGYRVRPFGRAAQ